MKIEITKCDKCGDVCNGDYFSIYRNSGDHVIGKSDICAICYTIAFEALEAELSGRDRPLPVSSYEELCKSIPNSGLEAFEKSVKEAIEFRTKIEKTN